MTTIDYAAMAKDSAKNQAKDSVTFDEGDSLILVYPSPQGFPEGHASLAVDVHGGRFSSQSPHDGPKVPGAFGRSVVDYNQPLCSNPSYLEALGFEPPTPSPFAPWSRENLDAKGVRGARAKTMWLWTIAVLGHRRPNAKAGTPFDDVYVKPQWSGWKQGSNSKPGLQAGFDAIVTREGPSVFPKLFDPDAAQLLIVTRKGTAWNATSWLMTLASGVDSKFGDLSEYNVPDEIRDDLDDATATGGVCDLFRVVAEKFSPSPDEIAERFGESGELPGMIEA